MTAPHNSATNGSALRTPDAGVLVSHARAASPRADASNGTSFGPSIGTSFGTSQASAPSAQSSTEHRLHRCPVCDATPGHWRSKDTPHGRFLIDRCAGCGLAFVNPRPSLEFLSAYYSTVGASNHPGARGVTLAQVMQEETRFPNSSIDAREMVAQLRAHLRASSPPLTLLDVGCGYGFFSKEAQRHGFAITAIELGPSRDVAREMLGIEPQPELFETFEAPPASFSAIIMSQVLEHVQDVNLWTQRAYTLLRPGGVLAIALPHFNSALRRVLDQRDPFITPPEHLNFFTGESLRLLLLRHGFRPGITEYRSRIPPRAIERRVGRLGWPAIATAQAAAGVVAKTLDHLGLGIMVRIYGTKPLEGIVSDL